MPDAELPGLDESSRLVSARPRDPARLAADPGAACSPETAPLVRPLIRVHRFEGARPQMWSRPSPTLVTASGFVLADDSALPWARVQPLPISAGHRPTRRGMVPNHVTPTGV